LALSEEKGARTLKPIEQPKSLMETTAEQIREAIVTGELPLGSKLSEQRLADIFGVSRSPVRDALASLQTEGLVNISAKRGSFVFTPDLKEVDDLCEYRAVLEAAALRMALARNPEALVSGLSKSIAEMQAALEQQDVRRYTRGDLQFHKTIIETCGNRSIAQAYERTISPVMALRTHLFTIMNATLDRSMEEHAGLVDACRSGDAGEAVRLLEEHVSHLVDAFRTALAEQETEQPSQTARR
jgi:DNA-binding GntR family transcriptional regulator